MATDYDAPRKSDEEMSEDSLEELKTRRNDKNSGKVDEDEVEAAESFELPGADLSHGSRMNSLAHPASSSNPRASWPRPRAISSTASTASDRDHRSILLRSRPGLLRPVFENQRRCM